MLADRDLEEDNLRQKRRNLERSSIGSFSHPSTNTEMTRASNGPAMSTRSKPMKRRSAGGPNLPPKDHRSRPTAHDNQGRALFTGLQTALRRHVSKPAYRHKMKGIFSCNNHAIEICGEVAPGQEGFEIAPDQHSLGIAAVAIMGSTETLNPPCSGSNIHGQRNWESRSDTLVGSEVDINTSSAGATERDHGSLYRASSFNRDSNMSHAKTRAQQAAEIYGGSISDSEEDHEGEPLAWALLSRLDRQVGSTEETDGCNPLYNGRELFDECVAQEQSIPDTPIQEATDSTIKEENGLSPSLSVEHHPVSPGPVTPNTPFKAARCPDLGAEDAYEKQYVSADTLPNGKRAASSPPCTPLQSQKRPRNADEPSTI